jgi:hypothetical protein
MGCNLSKSIKSVRSTCTAIGTTPFRSSILIMTDFFELSTTFVLSTAFVLLHRSQCAAARLTVRLHHALQYSRTIHHQTTTIYLIGSLLRTSTKRFSPSRKRRQCAYEHSCVAKRSRDTWFSSGVQNTIESSGTQHAS